MTAEKELIKALEECRSCLFEGNMDVAKFAIGNALRGYEAYEGKYKVSPLEEAEGADAFAVLKAHMEKARDTFMKTEGIESIGVLTANAIKAKRVIDMGLTIAAEKWAKESEAEAKDKGKVL